MFYIEKNRTIPAHALVQQLSVAVRRHATVRKKRQVRREDSGDQGILHSSTAINDGGLGEAKRVAFTPPPPNNVSVINLDSDSEIKGEREAVAVVEASTAAEDAARYEALLLREQAQQARR
ncbi:Hypothetical predicted protein [Olea europaea subsp. europaea]|uniref:Uncharacterized protein n=1 Tax=Olea europaea subsp. europaea TaxID=158383 RepID=A0A8S0TGE0_OLEEU|nr:Hypothetical predicted protein [Olea europaea subsp. europaea]